MPLDPGFIRSLDVKLIDRIPAAVDLMQFDCNEQLNWWLRNRARLYHIEKGISLVTCWLAGNDLAAYLSTSATRIEMDDPKDRKEVGLDGVTHTETGGYERNYPAMLIGMLGVANRFRCRGLGKHLVRHAIGQARELARITACRFVNVDSMNTPDALKMYRECKFKEPGKQKRAGSVAMYYDLFEQH